jgi:hypothetical protein
MENLFSDGQGVTKELLKSDVLKYFKKTNLIGVPEAKLKTDFSPDSGDDILIEQVDPENALGYSIYSGDQEYYENLMASLYVPTQEEIEEAASGV